jgi:hypothetical protein
MSALQRNPLRDVVRVAPSPTSRHVRLVQLSCGHDIEIQPGQRVPKVGKVLGCFKCVSAASDVPARANPNSSNTTL